jgi:hypothetical protein
MDNRVPLPERRLWLRERIEQERVALFEQAQLLRAAAMPLERVRQGFLHFSGHPLLWLASAGFTVFSVGPRRMLKTFFSAWNAWQIFRLLKKHGLGR